MSAPNFKARGRTLLTAKVIFNFGQSTIDCVVRRISDDGATVELESGLGIPEHFQLSIPSEGAVLPCRLAWQSERQIGVTFETLQAADDTAGAKQNEPAERGGDHVVRSQMLALRAALDQVPLGIVLLDSRLNARFINRAFRRMWALSDAVADRHPSFAALIFHGRDTGAYDIPADRIEAYVAERIERITRNESFQLDLRRTKGDVIRMQCTPLPDGGRMLSYMEVTDIVRQADELRALRDALETVQDGVLLLDGDLRSRFMNQKVRQFWEIDEPEAATRPSYASLITRTRRAVDPHASAKELAGFAAKRIAEVKAGDHVRELQTPDGRRLRAHCTTMTGGGRMITYYDVTDLIRNAEQLERLATTDPLTGLFNRRHFLEMLDAEWSRFQRYYRAVSVLMVDIDHFKDVNDRYGHAVGDEAIKAMAGACLHGKRKSDIVGRVGGEEFAIVLPETNLSRARIVAERVRKRIAGQALQARDAPFRITASIGIAEASVSMPGTEALMIAADQALYQAKAQGRNCCVCWSPPAPARLAAE
ncbi:diguanylate cyclase [Bradyrhizobium genosp. L]|uniref:sensor domain-containing diguanylate cyclase n=1 Tax=Bradyrhizobium genosp. L TaxID=83637 RepID=UPI0018A2D6BC|nr:sensor domain-containing diguanylate cyclase [Bradyrhizobium genosp. L]QPF84779.1 diguanylate cyclase [Bradyrhizobium genosp. L]